MLFKSMGCGDMDGTCHKRSMWINIVMLLFSVLQTCFQRMCRRIWNIPGKIRLHCFLENNIHSNCMNLTMLQNKHIVMK